VQNNHQSPQRRLIALRIEHADLDALIDRVVLQLPHDELMLQRMKKRRLVLRDQIASIERDLSPSEPA